MSSSRDQANGKAKEKVEDALLKVEEKAGEAIDKVKEALQRK